MSSNEPTTPDQPMTKEDIAFFIRTLWSSLLKPTWARGDLIDLGMELFSKTPLSQVNPKKFERLLPFLSQASEDFGKQVRAKFMVEFESFVKNLEAAYNERIQTLETQIESLHAQVPSTEVPTTNSQALDPAEVQNG
jgi:hypothetical protein